MTFSLPSPSWFAISSLLCPSGAIFKWRQDSVPVFTRLISCGVERLVFHERWRNCKSPGYFLNLKDLQQSRGITPNVSDLFILIRIISLALQLRCSIQQFYRQGMFINRNQTFFQTSFLKTSRALNLHLNNPFWFFTSHASVRASTRISAIWVTLLNCACAFFACDKRAYNS